MKKKVVGQQLLGGGAPLPVSLVRVLLALQQLPLFPAPLELVVDPFGAAGARHEPAPASQTRAPPSATPAAVQPLLSLSDVVLQGGERRGRQSHGLVQWRQNSRPGGPPCLLVFGFLSTLGSFK